MARDLRVLSMDERKKAVSAVQPIIVKMQRATIASQALAMAQAANKNPVFLAKLLDNPIAFAMWMRELRALGGIPNVRPVDSVQAVTHSEGQSTNGAINDGSGAIRPVTIAFIGDDVPIMDNRPEIMPQEQPNTITIHCPSSADDSCLDVDSGVEIQDQTITVPIQPTPKTPTKAKPIEMINEDVVDDLANEYEQTFGEILEGRHDKEIERHASFVAGEPRNITPRFDD